MIIGIWLEPIGVAGSQMPMVNRVSGGADMQRDELVAYCLGKPGAEETYPWGDAELVAKVGGKAFAFIGMDGRRVGLKSGRDDAEAAEWHDRYPGAVTASAYIGRYGWNAVDYTGAVPDEDLRELVDASYDAIVRALPERRRPPNG